MSPYESKTMYNRIFQITVCLLLALVTACAHLPFALNDSSASATATPALGEVRLYGNALSADPMDRLTQLVRARLGLQVQSLNMETVEMLSRVIGESVAPQSDVNFGTDSFNHIAMADRGLLEPYKGPGWQALPANLKDPDGYWVGLFTGVVALGYNPIRLQALGVQPPTSWQDLLNPKLKSQIVMPNPVSSGTAYDILFALVSLYGEDKGFQYLQALDQNIAYYSSGGSEPADAIASGKYAIGITYAYNFQVLADQGQPVKVAFPQEGTGWQLAAMSIVKGAKDMDAARAFEDLALGPEAQALFPLDHRAPVLPGVKVPGGTFTLDSVKIVPKDQQKLVTDRRRLTLLWNREIGARRATPVPATPTLLPATPTPRPVTVTPTLLAPALTPVQ